MLDRTRVRLAASALVAATAVAVAGLTASRTADAAATDPTASVPQPTLVNATPAPAGVTPAVDDGVVDSITQVGSTVVVGGSFSSVTRAGSSTAEPHPYLFAYDASGQSTPSTPQLDGRVDVVIPGPIPDTVYVGGAFTTVNGKPSHGLALLDLKNGKAVAGFTSPLASGVVRDLRLANGRLWVAGAFRKLGGVLHQGLGTVDPRTGAVNPYVNVQLTEHHNYNGTTGADGALGGRALDISADGAHAVVVGNFKKADGVLHDQIVMLDLRRTSATIDTHWNTAAFSAACARQSFDSYVEDVDFAPDGSAFDIATSGARTMSVNRDGTRSLCDSVSRWSTAATGADVKPTWVDYSGNDSYWVVEDTGVAVYAGGHARWMNNPLGFDSAGAGAVPRPGIVALDPSNGLPYSWNPGRNPRGKGTYALYATGDGLYVGSDTDWIGNRQIRLPRLAFFPLSNGRPPASTRTAALPSNVYQAGPLPGGVPPSDPAAANTMVQRAMNDVAIGAPTPLPGNAVAWGASRGAFTVGTRIYWSAPDPYDNNNYVLYRARFDGSVGTPEVVDPYDDPVWSNVKTGSKTTGSNQTTSSNQTYQGVKPTYYAELPSITGQFYADGKIFYTLAGQKPLYWRYFEADDGIIGQTEGSLDGVDFSNVQGMFRSGRTIYYAAASDGALHAVPFVNDRPTSGGSTVVAPGIDWRARNLLLAGAASFSGQPAANPTVSCVGLMCTFHGTSSSGADITRWLWNFGDGAIGHGQTFKHTYATVGTRTATLTVTDSAGAVTTGAVAVEAALPVRFVGARNATRVGATTVRITAPRGIRAGDTELLFVSVGSGDVAGSPRGLTGWRSIAHVSNGPLLTRVYRRTAAANDSRATVDVVLRRRAKVDVQFADYRNVHNVGLRAATRHDRNTRRHLNPAIRVTQPNSWVVTYWADLSSRTRAWHLPGRVVSRASGFGSGRGHVSAVTADSAGVVSTGTYRAAVARTNAVSSRGNSVTVVLPRAG